MNYTFLIDEWLPRFPLDEQEDRYSGDIITGPGNVCNNELLRREMQDQYHWGSAVPVDIFAMADGEPEDRSVTKIGGLPHRPANLPWPTDATGEPMLFLGQFNFKHSQDLVGRLPGELLLIFADDSSGTIEDLRFEWQPDRLVDLVDESSVPQHPSAFAPCFGHIHRTVSYPEAQLIVPHSERRYPTCRGKDVTSDYFLLQWQATQIGAAPFFIQGDPELPGRVFCTICSVGPDEHVPYPWVNHPEPLIPEEEWSFGNKYLMLGDTGCIYISIDEHQQLHWCEDCF